MRSVAVMSACIAALLSGCFLRGPVDASQVAVDSKALGVPAGDFFDRYGRPLARLERADGTFIFDWEGGSEHMAAGPNGMEDKICRLRLTTGKDGRIVSAEIMRDAKGERRLSRCAELFDH